MPLIITKLKNWIRKNKFLYFTWCKLSYFFYKKDLRVFLYNIEKDFLHNKKIYFNYDLDFDPALDGSFRESIEIKYKIFKAISLKYNNKKIKILDIVFVDGDHKDPVVSLDIFNSFKILKKEGLLIVDDLYSSERTGKIKELIGHAPSKDGLNAFKKLSFETNNKCNLLVKFYGPKNHFYNPMVGILRKK